MAWCQRARRAMTTPARVTGRRQPRRLWCNYFLLSRGPQSALPAFRPVLCGPQSCARLHPDDIASLERLAVARLAEHPSSADGLRPRLPKALSAGGPVSPSSSSSPSSCVRATISSFLGASSRPARTGARTARRSARPSPWPTSYTGAPHHAPNPCWQTSGTRRRGRRACHQTV